MYLLKTIFFDHKDLDLFLASSRIFFISLDGIFKNSFNLLEIESELSSKLGDDLLVR